MFCPKCGNNIENENAICENCGFDASKVFEDIKDAETTKEIQNSADSPIEEYTDVVPDESPAEVYEKTTPTQSKKIKTNSFKPLIVTLMVVAAIILIIAIVKAASTGGFGNNTYTITGENKIETAYTLIEEGSYDEALDKLANVNTDDAEVLRNYIELLKAKAAFSTACENKQRYETDSYYDEFYDALIKFEEENEIYRLPEEYKNDYKCCITAYEFNNRFFSDRNSDGTTLLDTMNNAQSIAFNLIDVNTSSKDGNHFNVNTLQTRMDTSQKALDRLNAIESPEVRVKYKDVINACHVDNVGWSYNLDTGAEKENYAITLSKYADNIFKSFRAGCKDGIAESQEDIDRALRDFSPDASIFHTEPYDSYSLDMGAKFEAVDSYDDMERNTDYLYRVLRADMLYYLIHGKTID